MIRIKYLLDSTPSKNAAGHLKLGQAEINSAEQSPW